MKHLQTFEQLNESRWTATSTEGDFDWDKLDKGQLDKGHNVSDELLNLNLSNTPKISKLVPELNNAALNVILSARSGYDIDTVEEFLQLSPSELRKLRGMGRKTFGNVLDSFKSVGLFFKIENKFDAESYDISWEDYKKSRSA